MKRFILAEPALSLFRLRGTVGSGSGRKRISLEGSLARFALYLAAAAVLAPTTAAAWTGYNFVTILQVTTYMPPAASGVLIKFSPTTQNLEGCSDTTGNYAWIDMSQSDGRAVYASVLAAHAAGRLIDIGVHGCNAEGIPRVYAVTHHP